MGRLSRFLLRLSKLPPQLLYAVGLGPVYGRLVLLLTTTGRKSGLPRVTPLQYEEIDDVFYVASARGQQADWFCNIVANPQVEVRVKARHFHGVAEPITDPARVADFLDLRLERHPRMIGAMFRVQGLPAQPNRTQLEQYAAKRAMVTITPLKIKVSSGRRDIPTPALAAQVQVCPPGLGPDSPGIGMPGLPELDRFSFSLSSR